MERESTRTKCMTANCEESQSPPRVVKPREKDEENSTNLGTKVYLWFSSVQPVTAHYYASVTATTNLPGF
jgi:hypothetical protein